MPGTFATDLVTLNAADAITGWTSLGTFTVPLRVDAATKIQGTGGLIGSGPTTANGTVYGVATFTAVNLSLGAHVYAWTLIGSAGASDTKANGGIRIGIGSGTAALSGTFPNDGLGSAGKNWRVDGIDTNAFSGWTCYVVDPMGTPNYTIGAPNMAAATYVGVGHRCTVAVLDTTFNFGVDVVRYGTGHTITAGTAVAPVTLQDIAGYDQLIANAFGVLINKSGSYYCGGKLSFGTGAQVALTYFKDTNKTLMFHDYPVSLTHYELIATGAATFPTTVMFGTLTGSATSGGCLLRSIGARQFALTASTYGSFMLYACTILGMRTAVLTTGSDFRNCSIVGSGPVVPAGAIVKGCNFSNGTAEALTINAPSDLTNVTGNDFSGCFRGLKITAAGTYTLDGMTFSGNTIDIENSSIGAVIINLVNGSNPVSTVNSGGGTTTINTTAGASITGLVTGSRVLIKRVDTGAVLFNGAETLNAVTYSGAYVGQVTIRVRQATIAPYYKEWSTLVTLVSGSSVGVVAQQVLDQ